MIVPRRPTLRSLTVSTCMLILSACIPGTSRFSTPVCGLDRGTVAELPFGMNLDHLTGRFRVRLNLSSNPDSTLLWGDMLLRSPTPEELSLANRNWSGKADLQLIGTMNWFGRREVPVQLDGGVIYVGCRGCFDGTPTILSVANSSVAGFSGSWDNNLLAESIERRTGEPPPDPLGTFCAMRL